MAFNIIWQSLSDQKQFLSLTFLEVNDWGILIMRACYYTENDVSTKARGRRYD